MNIRRTARGLLLSGWVGFLTGCYPTHQPELCGHLPPLAGPLDTWVPHGTGPFLAPPASTETPQKSDGKPEAFRLPAGLPGSDSPTIQLPRLTDLKPAEREGVVKDKYPPLPPVPPEVQPELAP